MFGFRSFSILFGIFGRKTGAVFNPLTSAVVAKKAGKALALRVVGLDRPGLLEQWWAMGASRDFGEFETALRRMQIPMWTIIYADREGRIMHFFNGLVPVRERGTDFWCLTSAKFGQGLISPKLWFPITEPS
jgi:acyl-homoserine-lactone acylase